MAVRRKMKLGVKLFLGFSAILLISVIVGLSGIQNIGQINALLSGMYQTNLLPIAQIGDAKGQALYHIRGAYRLIIETDEKQMAGIVEDGKKYLAAFQADLELYRKGLSSEDERAALAKFEGLWADYLKDYGQFSQLALSNRNVEANAFIASTLRPDFNKADAAMSGLIELNRRYAEESNARAEGVARSVTTLMILFILAGIALGLVLASIITRSITRSVGGEPDEIADIAERIAGGDLDVKAEEGKRLSGIYKSLLEMGEKLGAIVQTVQTAVSQVSSGSEQISVTAQEMS